MVIESSSNCLNKDALSQALQPIVIKIKGSHIFLSLVVILEYP